MIIYHWWYTDDLFTPIFDIFDFLLKHLHFFSFFGSFKATESF